MSGLPANGIAATAAFRRGSVSSINSTASAADESAIDDSGDASSGTMGPFARRMSFGARALREVKIPGRMGSGGGMGSPASPTNSRGEFLEVWKVYWWGVVIEG